MKLTAKCKKCNSEIKIRTWLSDRVELAKTKGEYLELSCQSCHATDKYHVDSFSAHSSRIAQISAFVIFLLGTPLIFVFVWKPLQKLTWSYAILALAGLLLIPITVYGLILKDDRRKVSLFNRHKLKGLGRN